MLQQRQEMPHRLSQPDMGSRYALPRKLLFIAQDFSNECEAQMQLLFEASTASLPT